MAGKLFDQDKFRELLKRAIGSRTQYTFSEISGISKSRLSHLMNDVNSGAPSKTTIRKVADSSEGRVTEEQLLAACGYETSEKTTEDGMPAKVYILKIANDLKEGVESFAGVSTKYNSIDDAVDTINLLYGPPGCKYLIQKEEKYEGRGRKGAENYVHCKYIFVKDDLEAVLPFILFYCKTEGGGAILSDCAFDLPTLMEMKNADAGKFLFKIAEEGDVKYTDFPIVLRVRRWNFDREKRLLQAIFGEENEKTEEESPEENS